MAFQPIILWTDGVIFGLVFMMGLAIRQIRRDPQLMAAWANVFARPTGFSTFVILVFFGLVGLADSVHFRPALPAEPGVPTQYSGEVLSVLDAALAPLRQNTEKTYSAPLATRLFSKETVELEGGGQGRVFPRLTFGGAHLQSEEQRLPDLLTRLGAGTLAGLALAALLWVAVMRLARKATTASTSRPTEAASQGPAWKAGLITIGALLLMTAVIGSLATGYHVFGTDKVGQDVLYLTIKSVRTALVIGTLTTLVMMPFAVALGVLAGYLGGWVDDAIQYLYTVLNSIPGVLLIAAAVLMMQVLIDTHPEWFSTAAERADARLLALCVILGVTSWTGLCRLLRGETLKLRELEYVQAARAFGVGTATILRRHVLPNVMHIVVISLVMDFSGLVLAEAVLSYVGIGVDPNTISFGTMINAARMELARDPMVWWSLVAAFVVMFVLVLAANLFADVVRDVFDPRRA